MANAVTSENGQMKIVKNVVQGLSAKSSTLTSLLTSNSSVASGKFSGRRIYMTKAADGTTRVIASSSNLLPKAVSGQQSVVKVQGAGGVQQLQIQQPGNSFTL